MNIVREIRDVIRLEKETIERLLGSIGREYAKAVELIYRCKGKIVLTGVGKSGIIAQKIASTMVSTGTPAIFLHPTEGMHGDVGIIQKKDIVIAVGKSGESGELRDILAAIKKMGARIIAITANPDSSVARYSHVVLHTRIEKEACPFNLAPTCSTTAALVAGDALAIALMRMRGFKKKDFALLHPGGLLGKRLLLTVRDVMRSGERNPVVAIGDSTKNMLSIITQKMCGAVSVVDGKGMLRGLVTDYDIRRVIERGENIYTKKISRIMNPRPLFIRPEVKAVNALRIMQKRTRPTSLMPVVGKNKSVVGMIHIHDILAHGL